MKKIIFLDIDGTLIDGSHGMLSMSECTKNAIREVQAAGHYVFIASGRPFAFIDQEILRFGFDGFVLMNGAVVIVNDEFIYKKALDKKFITEAITLFEKNRIEYVLQGEKQVYLKDEYKKLHDYFDTYGISKEYFMNDYAVESLDVYKLEMMCEDAKGQELCKSFAKYNVTYLQDPTRGMKFEIYAKQETKATGILKILDHFHLSIEDSYAFGDGLNDIEMLETVGNGIAMGNASEFVKQHANYVVRTVQQDGVAEGLEKYVLHKKN
ncbi:HAD family hydrolase [Anaerosinus massiliensis]|uniref:HAD family hydrolase n=1 Tax=Massilibacillus massiliensis TaxID=1806837 RepID=UPI000A9AB7A0|nr:HAD family hydrolase [Massilibacillus massiliensis]